MSNGEPPAKRAAMMDEYYDPVDMRAHYHLSQEDDTGPIVNGEGESSFCGTPWRNDIAEAFATSIDTNKAKFATPASISTPTPTSLVQSTFPPNAARTSRTASQQPIKAYYTSSALEALLSAPPPPPPPEPPVAPLLPPPALPSICADELFGASGDTDQRRGQPPNAGIFAKLSSPIGSPAGAGGWDEDDRSSATSATHGVGTGNYDQSPLSSSTLSPAPSSAPSPPQWPGRSVGPPPPPRPPPPGFGDSEQEEFPPLSAAVSKPTPPQHQAHYQRVESGSSNASSSFTPPGFTPPEADYRDYRNLPSSCPPPSRNGTLVLKRTPQSQPRSAFRRAAGGSSEQWPNDGHNDCEDAYGGEAASYARTRMNAGQQQFNRPNHQWPGSNEQREDEPDEWDDRIHQRIRTNDRGKFRGGMAGRTMIGNGAFGAGSGRRTMGGNGAAGGGGGWKRNDNSQYRYSPQSNDGRGRENEEEEEEDLELEPLDQQQNKLICPKDCSTPAFVTYTLRELKQAEQHVAESHLKGSEHGKVFDTHCHIDFLLNKLPNKGRQQNGGPNGRGMSGGSNRSSALTGTIFGSTMGENYEKYRASRKGSEYGVLFGGCIACFCHPSSFENDRDFNSLFSLPDIYGSFGCHPHWVADFTPFYRAAMIKALRHEKVVATGEIGLDYSSRGRGDPDRELQKRVFRDQIQIGLDVGKPLVIHCREAHDDCIEIMKELVPKDYKIHRHCVTQGWDEIGQWVEAFPNCYFGFTNYVTMERASEVHDVISRLALERIILETDAPYHVPVVLQSLGRRMSHPGMVVHVAAQIACLKKLNLKAVVRECRKNSQTLYGV